MLKKIEHYFTTVTARLPKISDKTYHWAAMAVVCVMTVAYIVLLLNRYWQFDFFFVDNVYFFSALWKLSRFQAPIVWHPLLGTINIFGDHFHPIILVIAGLLKIFPWNETVFIAMAVLFGISGYLAFLIGFKLIKSRPLTFILVLAYFLYLGAQNAMIYGFHEINFMPVFFLLAIFALLNQKFRWYWLSFGLLLLTKESLATVGIGMGLFAILGLPHLKKLGVMTIIISLAWFLIATKLIIPHFLHDRFLYDSSSYSSTVIPHSLTEGYQKLTYPPEKIETFTVSMLSFGLLPLLNLATLPLIIQDFLLRYVFSIPGNIQYTLGYHYGIGLVPLLFFSSIWSLKVLQDRFKMTWLLYVFAGLSLVMTLYYQRFYSIKAPLLLVTNGDFYKSTDANLFEWDFLSHVPQDGKVMTMNHLGLPLAKQDVVWFAHVLAEVKDYNPKYVVYDLRPGQNPNNYFPVTPEYAKQSTQELLDKGLFTIYYQNGDQYILVRTNKNY